MVESKKKIPEQVEEAQRENVPIPPIDFPIPLYEAMEGYRARVGSSRVGLIRIAVAEYLQERGVRIGS